MGERSHVGDNVTINILAFFDIHWSFIYFKLLKKSSSLVELGLLCKAKGLKRHQKTAVNIWLSLSVGLPVEEW